MDTEGDASDKNIPWATEYFGEEAVFGCEGNDIKVSFSEEFLEEFLEAAADFEPDVPPKQRFKPRLGRRFRIWVPLLPRREEGAQPSPE